jgi:hypothetical protein
MQKIREKPEMQAIRLLINNQELWNIKELRE